MFNDMFSGMTYRKGHINTANEFTPSPFFNTYPGEKMIFERHTSKVNFGTVTCAIQEGIITELDKNIIKTIAVFAPGFILKRTVKERLTLQNIIVSDKVCENAINRLHKYQLINFSRIVKADGEPLPNRLISLSQFGYRLATTLGVKQRFNPLAITTAEAYQVKAYAEGCQLLTNIQKNMIIDSFAYRPVHVKEGVENAIIRPTFSINLSGETLFCEVIRRHNGWTEDLIDKLSRYHLALDYRPTVVLCCETEEMAKQTAAILCTKNLDIDLLYTNDTASYGPEFEYFLYNFDNNGNKQIFEIMTDESEAS